MAIVQEAIRRLRYTFTSEGADKLASDLAKVNAGQAAVTATSTTTERAQLSLDKSFANMERRYVSTVKAQQDYEKVVRTVNAAVAQNPALQDRANTVLANAAAQYGQAGIAAKAFAAATGGVSGQLIALSAGAGPVGTFMAALGPWGVAAAVGLGAAEKAFSAMSDAAHGLAQKSQELRSFSEVTGLSTAQIQALRSEASKFGVTGDEVQSSIQQFTARFNDLRIGQGELLTQIRRVNPALADQMAGVTNAGDALTLFGKALQDVDNVFQRNALVKAATGKGGLSAASFLTGLDVSKITQSYVDAGKALDEGLIKKLPQLEIDIAKTSAKARQNIASIFSQDVLEMEKRAADQFLRLSEIAKNFTISDDLAKLLGLNGPASVPGAFEPFGWLKTLVQMLPAIRNLQTAGTSAMPAQGGTSFADRFQPANDNPLKSYKPSTDPRFELSNLKAWVDAMGDAASSADRLRLAEKQLEIAAKDLGLGTDKAKISQDDYNRALAVLRESSAVQKLQTRVGALGDAGASKRKCIETNESRSEKIIRADRERKEANDDSDKHCAAAAA